MERKIINVKPGGEMQFIHDDRLRGLFKQGEASIKRASAVEPGDPAKNQDPLQWFADLALVHGPILGGFDTRSEALDAEVEWINTNLLTEAQCKSV